MIDDNNTINLDDPMYNPRYANAIEQAWALGQSERLLDIDLSLDLVEAWTGNRTFRNMDVTLVGSPLILSAKEQISDDLLGLMGGVKHRLGYTEQIKGRSEIEFLQRDPASFLGWFWVEYVRVHPYLDGNKRSALIHLYYWMGRYLARGEYYSLLPSREWAHSLRQTNPHAAAYQIFNRDLIRLTS